MDQIACVSFEFWCTINDDYCTCIMSDIRVCRRQSQSTHLLGYRHSLALITVTTIKLHFNTSPDTDSVRIFLLHSWNNQSRTTKHKRRAKLANWIYSCDCTLFNAKVQNFNTLTLPLPVLGSRTIFSCFFMGVPILAVCAICWLLAALPGVAVVSSSDRESARPLRTGDIACLASEFFRHTTQKP